MESGSGAQLCEERADLTRGSLQGHLDSAGGWGRGWAIGAALSAWHRYDEQPRRAMGTDRMKGSYLGPRHTNAEIEQFLKQAVAPYELLDDEQLFDRVANDLAEGKVVGWLQGRMEFGLRALGGRSILGDARNTNDAVGHEPQD
ncbi:MAG: carbamoyltransferase C-terminal domain-containing protein [Nitrospira sp.]